MILSWRIFFSFIFIVSAFSTGGIPAAHAEVILEGEWQGDEQMEKFTSVASFSQGWHSAARNGSSQLASLPRAGDEQGIVGVIAFFIPGGPAVRSHLTRSIVLEPGATNIHSNDYELLVKLWSRHHAHDLERAIKDPEIKVIIRNSSQSIGRLGTNKLFKSDADGMRLDGRNTIPILGANVSDISIQLPNLESPISAKEYFALRDQERAAERNAVKVLPEAVEVPVTEH